MTTHPARSTFCGNSLAALVLTASPDLIAIPPPRKRRHYLQALNRAREILQDMDREGLPGVMKTFPDLVRREDDLDLEWIAWRDAILERAMALGYIAGQITSTTVTGTGWFCEAVGTIGSRTVRYPVSSPNVRASKAPDVGQAVLMTRGYEDDEFWYRRNRPYIPISQNFLHDPVEQD